MVRSMRYLPMKLGLQLIGRGGLAGRTVGDAGAAPAAPPAAPAVLVAIVVE